VAQSCHGVKPGGKEDKLTIAPDFDHFYATLGPEAATCVPLTAENAALPPECAERVHLVDILPPALVAELARDGVRCMGPQEPESARIRPAMGVEPDEYLGIIRKAVARGVCEWTRTKPESIQGLFGVFKDEEWARVILDCRPANARCRKPPNPLLPLIEILMKLGVEEGEQLYASILDLANYYHTLIMPEEWRTLFGLPSVMIDGVEWWPQWVTLPMGWNWSVYLAQLAHVHQLEQRSTVFQQCHRLGGPLVPRLLRRGMVASEPYLDDLPSLATTCEESNAGLKNMEAAEVVATKAEKVTLARQGASTRVWGVAVDPNGCLRPPPVKLTSLIGLTEAALLVPTLTPRALQRLVGRWLWFALHNRMLLSCFSPLFRQARSRRARLRVWPSSARALRDLIALAPLLVVDPSRRVGQLCATDASDKGGGVVIDRPFTAEDYWELAPLVYYKGRADLLTSEYQERLGGLLRPRRFATQFLWRWKDPSEHIGVKEGRAMFSGLRRVLLRSGAVIGRRHLFLVDNQGVVGAFTRGRSTNSIVNSLIQRTAAALMATASTVDTIWVPTRFQPADRASRV
jgi:hypothetical protein